MDADANLNAEGNDEDDGSSFSAKERGAPMFRTE